MRPKIPLTINHFLCPLHIGGQQRSCYQPNCMCSFKIYMDFYLLLLLFFFFSSSLTPRSLLPPPPPPLHHLLHTKRPQFIFLLSVRDGHCFHWREGAREISSSIFSCRAVSPSLSPSQSHGSGQNLDDYDDSDDDDAVDRDPTGIGF